MLSILLSVFDSQTSVRVVFCLSLLSVFDLQAAVRGLDTIQSLAAEVSNVSVNKFLVFGGSKVRYILTLVVLNKVICNAHF